ncbi:MAG: penicillin-binding protein 1C [Burkholderiales bacterium]
MTSSRRRLVSVVAMALLAALPFAAVADALPSFDAVRAAHRPSDVTLLDRHGVSIQTVRVNDKVRRLPWLPLEALSPALLHAVVLSEDQRFYEHSGVDWSAIANSAWANLWNRRTRGASTLTMQLAGLLDADLARPAGGRSVGQKVDQVLTARRLEREWSKARIIEAYLNSVPFRGELVGIGALSLTLFGKHASGLDSHEAAIAAALLRAPNASAQAVAQRACGVLQRQQLPCTGIGALTVHALARPGGMPLGEQLAPHVARQIVDPDGAAEQRSTLDARVQRFAIQSLQRQLGELAGRHVRDGAVLVLDNASGEVLAWVGGSGALSEARQVDHVLARRQPGSTLKPFVYALAFEKRLITPASLIDDSPAQIATQSGLYLPQNYDRDFKGWVSARTALGASLNVPAVRVGALVGADALAARLNAFGLALPEPGGYYGSSLALGSAEVTLLALTNAYRALANGGVVGPVVVSGAPGIAGGTPITANGVPPRPLSAGVVRAHERVMSEAAAHLATDILADNNARVRTFGSDSLLATRGFAAVKTGTSKDLRDNWCVGFTDRFTVGVWVGNTDGAPMHDSSGISGAAPVWRAVVEHLHAGRPSLPPPVPAGVIEMQVSFAGQREPARREVFIAGTQQSVQLASTQLSNDRTLARSFGIESPKDGSIFALDPDIPADAQRITFAGEPGDWLLDGAPVGRTSRATPQLHWAPWPGRHRLTLQGDTGAVLATIGFEVRGARVRTSATGGSPTTERR